MANGNGNGDSIWKFATVLLTGIVLSLAGVWFTSVRDAATKHDVEAVAREVQRLSTEVTKVTTRLDERDRRDDVREGRR